MKDPIDFEIHREKIEEFKVKRIYATMRAQEAESHPCVSPLPFPFPFIFHRARLPDSSSLGSNRQIRPLARINRQLHRHRL